jgi:hypothetical protein
VARSRIDSHGRRLQKRLTFSSRTPRLASHRQLSAERVFIALDSSDSEITAGAAKADKAIPIRETALDKCLVPFLRMADINGSKGQSVSSRRMGPS